MRLLLCRTAGILLIASCSLGPSSDSGLGMAPTAPPAPTGQAWEGRQTTDACGRTTIEYVLVDEVCSGFNRDDYGQRFRAPMFRDAARIGDYLFAVDATHMWVIDVHDPTHTPRSALVAGLGQPYALQSRGNQLVVASLDDGLVLVDVTKPDGPEVTSRIPMPGPALDVRVLGDLAYVALGSGGLAVVNLKGTPPSIARVLDVGGFASAVDVSGNYAYVAMCDRLAVLDLASGKVVSSAWVDEPFNDGVLVAAAKDVAVVGSVVFVAAGRYGAVALDVAQPDAPRVIGNCTIPHDPAFYASGVRTDDNKLFIAGGEWGILAVDVTDPRKACPNTVLPLMPAPPPAPGEPVGSEEPGVPDPDRTVECDSKPPWEVLPWEELWAPPPAEWDPIQTLPFGSVVYAIGDARRLGLRAIDIRSTLNPPVLPMVGRYQEPWLMTSIAAFGGRVVATGPGGGVFRRTDDLQPLVRETHTPTFMQEASAAVFLSDGSYAVVRSVQYEAEVLFEDSPTPRVAPVSGAQLGGVAAFGDQVVIAHANGLVRVTRDAEAHRMDSNHPARLPPAVAVTGQGRYYMAAPEWTRARAISASTSSALAPHGVFDDRGILDAGRWQQGLPRRLLHAADLGLVEVATLGQEAGLYWHQTAARLKLPRGTYTGIAHSGDLVFLAAHDRGLYRSSITTIRMGAKQLEAVGTRVFTGVATGVAVDGDRVYVADADSGIRVYRQLDGDLIPLGLVEPEDGP